MLYINNNVHINYIWHITKSVRYEKTSYAIILLHKKINE